MALAYWSNQAHASRAYANGRCVVVVHSTTIVLLLTQVKKSAAGDIQLSTDVHTSNTDDLHFEAACHSCCCPQQQHTSTVLGCAFHFLQCYQHNLEETTTYTDVHDQTQPPTQLKALVQTSGLGLHWTDL